MRVLLFVEREGRGPKCVWRAKRVNAAYFVEVVAAIQGGDLREHRWPHSTAAAASRWWLVQAADAAEGRATIAAHRARLVGAVTGTAFKDGDIFRPLGRVLASGGRP